MKEIMTYVNRWYLFVLAIAISLTSAFFYLKFATPIYKITSTLLIEDNKEKGNQVLQGTPFSDLDMFRMAKTVDNEIEVLRSKDLLAKVIKSLDLQVTYKVQNVFVKKELYGKKLPVRVNIHKLEQAAYLKKLSIEVIDKETFIFNDGENRTRYNFNQKIRRPEYTISVGKGPDFKTAAAEVFFQFNNQKQLTESYNLSRLIIMPVVKDANTIVLSLEDAVPQRGVDFLNTLIAMYNLRDVNQKNIIARSTIKFIDNRLRYLTGDLAQVEKDVENYKQQNKVTNISADAEQSLQHSGTYDQQLAAADIQLNIVSSLENYLNKNDDGNGLVPSTLGLQDATLLSLTNRYNELQLQRQQLLHTANAQNPLVLNISEQLEKIKISLKESLKNVKRGLLVQRENFASKYDDLDSRIRSVPAIERGLLERSREESVKQTLYQYLLQKREEAALSISATIPTSQVVDKPSFGSMPVSPKRQLIYLAAFLIGLIIPASGIYAKNKLNFKVKDMNEVELIPGAKILGELSHQPQKEPLVVQRGSRTTISELFRYIRNNLRFMTTDGKNQVLLITSGIQGEGKTFFSINLGATLSLTDKKVVLLEFDLRKPDLLNNLKIKQQKGIAEYLVSSTMSVDEIVRPSHILPNVWVIGCGLPPEDPSELLLSHKMEKLFDSLRQKFDYILIDTSPVGQVSDAFSIAPYADSSIYLIRYNYTNKLQLKVLEDIYEQKRFNNPMIVFNDAKVNNRTYAYGNSKYGT
ncbi:GumC family protein [Desertivirga arenae]|uniref:GumC family protein n=1 Tax=Desertivirga arenae TaxID=2810309 RepID=UPI001A96D24B|nr:polysaccharide biosynthesis tyrosine autokinase [Pedobacter sp. SYSU D00823]